MPGLDVPDRTDQGEAMKIKCRHCGKDAFRRFKKFDLRKSEVRIVYAHGKRKYCAVRMEIWRDEEMSRRGK